MRRVLAAMGKPLPPPVEFEPEAGSDEWCAAVVAARADPGTAEEIFGYACGSTGPEALALKAAGWRPRRENAGGDRRSIWYPPGWQHPADRIVRDRTEPGTVEEIFGHAVVTNGPETRALKAAGWEPRSVMAEGELSRVWYPPGWEHPAAAIVRDRIESGTAEEIFGRKCAAWGPEIQALKAGGWKFRNVKRGGKVSRVWYPPNYIDATVNSAVR